MMMMMMMMMLMLFNILGKHHLSGMTIVSMGCGSLGYHENASPTIWGDGKSSQVWSARCCACWGAFHSEVCRVVADAVGSGCCTAGLDAFCCWGRLWKGWNSRIRLSTDL